MAKPSQPPPKEFGPLSELGRKYPAQRETMRKQRLDAWNKRHPSRPPPTEQDLRNFGVFLTDNPERIEEVDPFYVYHAFKWLVEKIPNRPFRPKVMAALVDALVDAGMPLGEARQEVSDRSGKSVETVKQAHLRHGKKRKRDKSR
jgi:hypothetical protein